MKNNFLEIKGVDFIIGGKTKVKNASFAIENEGETLCILAVSYTHLTLPTTTFV